MPSPDDQLLISRLLSRTMLSSPGPASRLLACLPLTSCIRKGAVGAGWIGFRGSGRESSLTGRGSLAGIAEDRCGGRGCPRGPSHRAVFPLLYSASGVHGDFASYHRRFQHDDATLLCRCDEEKSPTHFFFCRLASPSSSNIVVPSHCKIKKGLSFVLISTITEKGQ